MNKLGLRKEFYNEVKNKFPKLNKPQINEILETAIKLMAEALISTNRLSIRHFGVFEILYFKDRKGFNPKTKQQITITGRSKIKFKPAKELNNKINQR